jgi:hypothetical protein
MSNRELHLLSCEQKKQEMILIRILLDVDGIEDACRFAYAVSADESAIRGELSD